MTLTQGIIWLASWTLALILAPIIWLVLLLVRVLHYQREHYRKEGATEIVWEKFKGYKEKGD